MAGRLLLTVVVGIALLMVIPVVPGSGSSAPAISGHSAAPIPSGPRVPAAAMPPLTATAPALSVPSTADSSVASAEASLARGEGPAGGTPLTCASSGLGRASATCGAPAPARGQPLAAAVNPIGDSGWEVQGVPSSRSWINYGITWDNADGYVLLFGGSNETGTYMADTWSYRSGIWSQLFSSIAPVGRDSAGLAYDYNYGAVILFGGFTPGTAYSLNDTWSFVGGAWTPLSVNGPSARYGFGFAYDPDVFGELLFGGYSQACTVTNSNGLCSDTWAFEFGQWFHLSPGTSPPARDQPSLTYDTLDGYAVLFGGWGAAGCVQPAGYCGDTWKYAAGTWAQVATGGTPCGNNATGKCAPTAAPGERSEAAVAWDPADNYAVLFGGSNASSYIMADTWRYAGGSWTLVAASSPGPWSRYGAGLVYDATPGDGMIFLYGGGPPYNTPVDIYWGYVAGKWTEVKPPANGPPNSYGASMTYDVRDGYVLYFGGYGSGTYYAQTWAYRSGVWIQLPEPVSGSPTGRWAASMTYDPQVGAVVLFGGGSPFGLLNDTWYFADGRWTEICAGGGSLCNGYYPPARREGAGMAFLPVNNLLVLFGGYGGRTGFGFLNDTYYFFGGSWVNWSFAFTRAPTPRAFMGLTYDPADLELVLFGGGNFSSAAQDTWTMTNFFGGGNAWTEVGSCGGPGQVACGGSTPAPRAGAIQVYDAVDGGVLVSTGTTGAFGGGLRASTNLFVGGTWYACGGWTCSGWYGVAPLTLDSAAAFDPADGYTVLRGGLQASGLSSYPFKDNYVFGSFLGGSSPNVGPYLIDLGQTTTFAAGASGGGTGSHVFQWNGVPGGCAPGVPGAATFSCAVDSPGYTAYFNGIVPYGSYYDPSVVVFDTDGFPSVTSSEFEWLYVARDARVVGSDTATVADVGQVVNFSEYGFDGWGPYTLTWAGLQTGCTVTVNTGSQEHLSCALTSASLGQFTLTPELTDAAGFAAQGAPLTVTVNPDPTATGITANRLALDTGQTFSVGVTPQGGSGGYTYAWSQVPPACLADTQVLTCTVPGSEAGTYDPTVTITDSLGESVTQTFAGSIVVSTAPSASALSVSRGTTPAVSSDAGQTVTFDLTSTPGSGGGSVVWNGLPAGCTAPAGALTVSCAPTAAGTYGVQAVVTDSNGGSATSPSATLTVSPALGTVQLSPSSSTPVVGSSLTLAAFVTGGASPDSYAWSGLPAGCAASNAAVVTCSPSSVGSTTVQVTVADANGATTTGTVVVNVVAAPAAPFATPFQELELGLLLAGLVLLAVTIVLLLGRRRTSGATMVMSRTPAAPGPERPSPTRPPGIVPPGPSAPAPAKPDYVED